MTGHSKVSFVNSIIHLVATVALDLVFIPRLGVVGAALGVMLSSVLINVVRLLEMVFLLRIRPYDRSFLKPVLAAVAAAVPAYLVNQPLTSTPWAVQLGVGVPLLVGIYVLAIVLLGLSDEDRLILERLRVRLGLGRRAGA
jgi:O-antigen/teichoic acid export membrane protein